MELHTVRNIGEKKKIIFSDALQLKQINICKSKIKC